MFKTILATAAVVFTSLPALAEPSPRLAVSVRDIGSNITCRTKAKQKFLQYGATGLSSDSDNFQWADINGMSALIWCRSPHVHIVVAGQNTSSVVELRNELNTLF